MSLVLLLLSACNREIPILVNDWCADERDATILEIVDGDTVKVDNGETLRLLGIDAPEIYYTGSSDCTSQEASACCNGVEAEDWLQDLLPLGTRVRLSFDLECEDTYSRTLAYVWLPSTEDTGASEIFINELTIVEGMSRLFDQDIGSALDIRYYNRFQAAQTNAQGQGAGLWGACY
jgi:micrococcal nuclease